MVLRRPTARQLPAPLAPRRAPAAESALQAEMYITLPRSFRYSFVPQTHLKQLHAPPQALCLASGGCTSPQARDSAYQDSYRHHHQR
jgi:hypothetical protein